MKKFLPLFLLPLLAGCLTFSKGGLVGGIQTANEKYLLSKGVPIELIQQGREAAGMPDVRTLPGPERVLPESLMLVYDVRDRNQGDKVVDMSGFYRSTMPRIVPAGTAQPSIFDEVAPSEDVISKLSNLLKKIDLSKGTKTLTP